LDNYDTDYLVKKEKLHEVVKLYVGPGNVDLTSPLLSPVFAEESIIKCFPPTLLQVSSAEQLLGDAVLFAKKFSDNKLQLEIWKQVPHVWQAFPLPESAEALQNISTFLRDIVPCSKIRNKIRLEIFLEIL
jgi:monoterpene epsilon-lactone hydrolase